MKNRIRRGTVGIGRWHAVIGASLAVAMGTGIVVGARERKPKEYEEVTALRRALDIRAHRVEYDDPVPPPPARKRRAPGYEAGSGIDSIKITKVPTQNRDSVWNVDFEQVPVNGRVVPDSSMWIRVNLTTGKTSAWFGP